MIQKASDNISLNNTTHMTLPFNDNMADLSAYI